jgi:hypothetical protein
MHRPRYRHQLLHVQPADPGGQAAHARLAQRTRHREELIMFGRNKAPQGLSRGSNPGNVKHSIVMTGRCSGCRSTAEVPHSFNAPWGWEGKVVDNVTCHCGNTVAVSAYSG